MNDTHSPGPDEPADDECALLARGLLPIREVARQTGVNPVTLRAWERRYGLIVPQRTPKGHRLYSAVQVAQIREILDWLERGVAVSQVRGLLGGARPPADADEHDWPMRRRQLLEAVAALAERALDDGFNQAMALYPPATLCRQLLLPLLDELHRRWRNPLGARLEQVFFLSWLRSKLGARLYHHNRLHGRSPLLLLNLAERPMEPGLWLCAWLASNAECPVSVLDWPVPAPELALAVERMRPRAVLLYGRRSLDTAHLQRLLQGVGCPRLLCGPAASIHREALAPLAGLHLADDPLDALQRLQALGLLGGPSGESPCVN
ncbi:MerR family transcriptional regulator [Azotobacter beijerinckii]|uniref:DNA-binding transcriptional regulator, MerR family n=1 Tax=Azotobacter beijerinckii TaxID=170623 RepID=A0A1I4AH65_9GAMM|nr:MerR family transcriptional regulator [Azotobacter beijerinckii]SFA94017.1 DNA-binding transcriptional regulator, MerR family [Azotobacter beijerinckii]SFK55079.1 DNA-binding transcriptional regulator, MerR family [Azotobacter beijerinckii]